ncbi:MAG: hypothetical protein ABJL55_17940 [Roseibium sp.]
MADKNICLENAKKIDPQATLCDGWVCETNENYVHKFCHCQPPNIPQNPCPYGANYPVPVFSESGNICYCCCSCFAWHTPVAVPEGEPKPIQTFEIGDKVLAAGADLKWTPYAVEFSDGVPPSPELGKTMFSVYFNRKGKVSSLIVTADHVFVLSNNKLKRAEHLVPGTDKLLSDDGEAVELLALEVGGWFGGVHHIATSQTTATSMDGHLLSSKGIVTGDWALQMADIEGGRVGDAAGMDGTAKAATEAYLQENSNLEGDIFCHAVKGADWQGARHEYFQPYSADMSEVPESAMRFVTKVQAQDIYKNAVQAPVSSSIGKDIVNYLFKLFSGFYPDVNFRLDWPALEPNAFSWRTYGVPFVVLNGGLVRMEGVNFNTLALVIAHELGHLYGGPPLTGTGEYSCEGQADYAATIGVLRGVIYTTQYYATTSAAVDSVETFFSYIDTENRKGVPGQTCNGLSIDCRMRAFRAGLHTQFLPECAGGPSEDYLVLESAVASLAEEGEACVALMFNEFLDLASALHPQNYTFEPDAEVLGVERVESERNAVTVTAKLVEGEAYQVIVRNVISSSGNALKGDVGGADVTWSKVQ